MAITITTEDIDYILHKVDEQVSQTYVKQDTCNDTQKSVEKRFANDDKRIELGLQEFATIKKLLWVIASTSIVSIVNSILNAILK